MNREMQEALEADGEKLRQLTGHDHGPAFIYPIGDLIAKYVELKATVEALSAKHDKELEPFREAMAVISGTIHGELNVQNLQNFKSDAGTAYLSTVMSVKVVDRVAYLDYLISAEDWNMLDARALKDPVKEFLEKSDGVPPPGLKIEFNTSCNIRKS